MQAIKTEYRGVTFRSRLEARWAIFFDDMEWPWQYEQHTLRLSDGSHYTPDFLIEPRLAGKIFTEIKPLEPTGFEIFKLRSAEPILLLIGQPSFRDYWFLDKGDEHLMLLETWVKAPMDRVVDETYFSIRYHKAVEKARHARFDGFDKDRETIRYRYD